MGYDLYFTRADHWPDSVMYPISLQEWVAVADEEPRLTKHQRDGHHPVYELAAPDDEGSNWTLGWRDGMVTIWKAHEASAELAAIARKLGARLVGDDSEEYHPDGERAFVLSFVRQLATGPGDGLVQVECRLDYRMTPDLAGLGTVTEWWFPEDGLVRDAWFAALADRPEWRLLNILTPKAFTFSSDTVC